MQLLVSPLAHPSSSRAGFLQREPCYEQQNTSHSVPPRASHCAHKTTHIIISGFTLSDIFFFFSFNPKGMQIRQYGIHSSSTADFTKRGWFFNVWKNHPWSDFSQGLHLLVDLSLSSHRAVKILMCDKTLLQIFLFRK